MLAAFRIAHAWLLILISIGLALYHPFVTKASFPKRPLIAIHLVLAFLLAWLALAGGLTIRSLGLAPDRVPAGLLVGGSIVAGVAILVLVAMAIPSLRRRLPERPPGLTLGVFLLDLLVQLPFATVLLEEVAYRGLLLAGWLALTSRWPAVLASSLAFGLWHIGPTWQSTARPGKPLLKVLLAVTGIVLVTVVGGVVFAWLLICTHSIVAPALAHMTYNGTGKVVAYLGRKPKPQPEPG